MDYSEKWGKDVDEAVRLALEDLGCSEDEVMVTVIEEPTKGIFGLGNKLAKVRVEKLQAEPPVGKRESVPDGNKIQGERKGVRDLRKKSKPQQAGGRSDSPRENGGDGHRGERRDRGNYRGDRRNNNHGRNDRGGYGGRRNDYKREEIDYSQFDYSNKPQLSKRPEGLVETDGNNATEFLNNIARDMGINVTVKTLENDECIFFEVSGPDSDMMIGKRGQTLDALQYLTNLVNNKERDEYKRAVIDIEGYRSRREKVLEGLSVKLAAKVRRTGRSVKLEPMNPYERKVIHATLQEIDGVTTRSEGEEPYRRVIIERAR